MQNIQITRNTTVGEHAVLFALGGAAYVALELAWRGRSHWTMFAAGGLCLCFLRRLAGARLPLGRAAVLGAGAVSLVELCAGAACRLAHLAVWDYADEWGNLAGLICPKYCALWVLLCGWVLYWLRRLGQRPAASLLKVPFIVSKGA